MPSSDARLDRLLRCAEDERDAEIEHLLETVARPVAEGVLQRFAGSGDALSRQDAEDVMATIVLRLVGRLREAAASPDRVIERFPDYVATIAFNAVSDHLRRSYPERTHVRNRLRYTLNHDRRLALWTVREQLAGGLAEWRGATRVREQAIAELPDAVLAVARDRDRPAEALVALFRHEGEPVLLRVLVDTLLPLWGRTVPHLAAEQPSLTATLEWRELLAAMWREITELRPLQRKALLLNLRDTGTSHALDLFAVTKTATMDEIARALEMTPGALAAVWNDLPIDDLRIASLLGLSRQQVISLRKSARERLTRRLAHLRRS